MNIHKIIAVTGARSEYDLMHSVYELLNKDEAFDFSIAITGTHLSEGFGLTEKEVLKDRFRIADKIYSLVDTDRPIGRVISLGSQISGLAQTLSRESPDLVLVAGDREEAVSTSITAAYMNIPVAHFFGGDIAKDGNIDNSARYATSKFAHLHFTTLEQHRENLLKLGEEDWRIHVVGNPALDRFLNSPVLSRKELSRQVNTEVPERYGILIQHPIITQIDQQAQHIEETLEAILQTEMKYFVSYPNSDAGNSAIISAYKKFAREHPNKIFLYQNLGRIEYINLLRHATIMLGNSSSGLLEAPSLKLPVINIGSRQRGRVHGENMIFVDNDRDEILEAINIALNDQKFIERVKLGHNPYGDGRTAQKVISILKSISVNPDLLFKNITY